MKTSSDETAFAQIFQFYTGSKYFNFRWAQRRRRRAIPNVAIFQDRIWNWSSLISYSIFFSW